MATSRMHTRAVDGADVLARTLEARQCTPPACSPLSECSLLLQRPQARARRAVARARVARARQRLSLDSNASILAAID